MKRKLNARCFWGKVDIPEPNTIKMPVIYVGTPNSVNPEELKSSSIEQGNQHASPVAWVIDIRSEYHPEANYSLKSLIAYCHKSGDYLYVRTNISIESFLKGSFTADNENQPRIARRLKELLGLQVSAADPFLENVQNIRKCRNKPITDEGLFGRLISSLKTLCTVSQAEGITPCELPSNYKNFIELMPSYYPGIVLENGQIDIESIRNIGDENLTALYKDIKFFRVCPYTPSENMFSQLETFDCRDEKQQEWLNDGLSVLQSLEQPNNRGIFLCGEPGKGKTHMSVSIAKELLLAGYLPVYINQEILSAIGDKVYSQSINSIENQQGVCWIIDDGNNPFSNVGNAFRRLINNRGEKDILLVTSNNHYKQFIESNISGAGVIGDLRENFIQRCMTLFRGHNPNNTVSENGVVAPQRAGINEKTA